mmetsp:Transcript_39261/g.94989  ORF Transcript_39261/g.94989 Transcript_39261/m.94989 type:complete len:120 (-) Transcript_39261:1683-2042(-)
MRNQRRSGCYGRSHYLLKWTKALCFLIFLVTRAEGRSFFNRQSSSQVDDPYGVLGVGRYASTDEIKSAYRAKVCFGCTKMVTRLRFLTSSIYPVIVSHAVVCFFLLTTPFTTTGKSVAP